MAPVRAARTAARLRLAAEPVDSLTITTLVDNVTDALLFDEGPAKRPSLARSAYPSVNARFGYCVLLGRSAKGRGVEKIAPQDGVRDFPLAICHHFLSGGAPRGKESAGEDGEVTFAEEA